MAIVMKNTDLVKKAKDIATNYKTLYVYACFGAPMTQRNKERYTNNCDYNRQPSRKKKILSASTDTFGFDCVNLIKGILWGWDGNVNATYGGAVYASNGVPDTNANGMFQNYCYDKSSDFSNLQPGEFVWMNGHIGIVTDDTRLAVECTPIWKDGVQITSINCNVPGYNRRDWAMHGKSQFIEYTNNPNEIEEYLKPRGYLTKGDNSQKIKDICEWFSKNKIDGTYFGNYLEAIVKVYQQEKGKNKVGDPDGNIGPRTLQAMVDDGFDI